MAWKKIDLNFQFGESVILLDGTTVYFAGWLDPETVMLTDTNPTGLSEDDVVSGWPLSVDKFFRTIPEYN